MTELKLTIQDRFDLMILILAIDTTRDRIMRSIQTINKPAVAWKNESDEEMDRLERLRAQLMSELIK